MSTRSIRISESAYLAVAEQAKLEGRTITEVMRRAVAAYLAEHDERARGPRMEGLVCDRCGEPVSLEPTWRVGHNGWEHRCRDLIPQAGYQGRAVSLVMRG